MLLCLHCHLSSIFSCQLFSLEEPLIENHFTRVVSKLNHVLCIITRLNSCQILLGMELHQNVLYFKNVYSLHCMYLLGQKIKSDKFQIVNKISFHISDPWN